jgi:hypothetical protein
MSNKLKRPGQIAKRSGQYEIIGPRGRRTGQERTITKGRRIPPTPKPKQRFSLVDPTKNKSGNRRFLAGRLKRT